MDFHKGLRPIITHYASGLYYIALNTIDEKKKHIDFSLSFSLFLLNQPQEPAIRMVDLHDVTDVQDYRIR